MAENSATTPLREVIIPRKDFQSMAALVRTVEHLSSLPEYRKALHDRLPDVARFDPGHDAVMMGYDFHVGPEGPSLIEVNTNAGGGLLALHAGDPESKNHLATDSRLVARLRAMFLLRCSGFQSDGSIVHSMW